jgi:hypothetical protein
VDQLTIRGFDPELERRIRQVAEEKGLSLSKAVLWLLRRGAGLSDGSARGPVVGSSLDHLIGSWTKDEGRELLGSLEVFEAIDESLWS